MAAIVSINDTDTLEQMIQILENPQIESEMRMDAAWALGELGDSRAKAPLRDSLTDDDTRIQMRAGEALVKLDRRGD